MIKITLLTPALLLIGCNSTPPPQQTQQQIPVPQQQLQSDNSAPPVVAQQPYPATPQGSPATQQEVPQVSPDPVPQPQAQQKVQFDIPSGTAIHVRLNQTLDTRRNRSGDRFTASLTQPVVEDGRTVVPKGTVFTGHVTTSTPSGRLKGRAVMGLTLDSFEINGANYPVVTTRASRVSARHKKRNLVLIGGGSGLGALVGGLVGGGKGALIGAGAGAGAGTAGAAATGKKEVTLPAETLLTFRLEENVEL
jgi:hypothetical protein